MFYSLYKTLQHFLQKIPCFLPGLFSFSIFLVAAYSVRFLCGIPANRKAFRLDELHQCFEVFPLLVPLGFLDYFLHLAEAEPFHV